ncbi:MAG TPA: ornithine carbamoyltransferase [Jatrophihabitans sp.]
MSDRARSDLSGASPTPARGSLLKEIDLCPADFLDLVNLAAHLKLVKKAGAEVPQLTGRTIALIFEKASTRTRCAFEVAAFDQGAHVTYIGPDGSHLGREESVRDTARVLGRMYDGIEFRGFAQDTVEELARHAGVPVWNGLTDQWHPTQMLADVLTMTEHHAGAIGEIAVCYLGDARNNVARSLLVTGAMLGMDVRVAAPGLLAPPHEVRDLAGGLATASGARVTVTDDPVAGVAGADFVYTDVWVSMGEAPERWDERVPLLTPYRVTPELMQHTGKATTRFLHCLPSMHDATTVAGRRALDRFGLHGVEVDDAVFESPASIVFDQAENRMHTIKAIMVAALGA